MVETMARKKAKAPLYAKVPETTFLRTYVCEDMTKCLCFYRAPDADAVVSLPPITVDELLVERPDVLVVGAGPGGLAAAHAARLAGADVLVLDEGSAPGGQYFKQCAAADVAPPDAQHHEGRHLIDDVLGSGVTVRSNVSVW